MTDLEWKINLVLQSVTFDRFGLGAPSIVFRNQGTAEIPWYD